MLMTQENQFRANFIGTQHEKSGVGGGGTSRALVFYQLYAAAAAAASSAMMITNLVVVSVVLALKRVERDLAPSGLSDPGP